MLKNISFDPADRVESGMCMLPRVGSGMAPDRTAASAVLPLALRLRLALAEGAAGSADTPRSHRPLDGAPLSLIPVIGWGPRPSPRLKKISLTLKLVESDLRLF